MNRILIIDDEQEITDLIELFLQNENFQVSKCYCSQDALVLINNERFDLAIIDVMLPDGNGFELCKLIREKYTFPIIMLTSKTEGIDRVTGLSLGADDYVTKPFLPVELVARVKAQLRRVQLYDGKESSTSETLMVTGLFLNKRSHECNLNGKKIRLTPLEFSILWLLCKNRGIVFSADELFQQVWGEKYFKNNRNTVMVQIRHIREKLNDTGENPKFIKTIWGVGYIIE
ncbi:response regulator transcription factor [Paenibacillus riograndensis]|uniref:Regulatory protein VanR n=2 Tax=Paenibacillus riograndensis TaxID=483937 RepID=A0A0E4HBD5_9BACL|nr:response regulator transcription factor [Paenibacillus riograndensis]CQR56579.1 Regulatory protein VanR [Paenibacillus riograndensis SBR5]